MAFWNRQKRLRAERKMVQETTERQYLAGSMAKTAKAVMLLNTQWTASIYFDSTYFTVHDWRNIARPITWNFLSGSLRWKSLCEPTWYQKEVIIPADWKNSRIILFLERPHTETHGLTMLKWACKTRSPCRISSKSVNTLKREKQDYTHW